MRRIAEVFGTIVIAALLLGAGRAWAALVVDDPLADTGQIRSATNNPYFGPGSTANLGAVNISYNTPAGNATLNGIAFHDLDLQSNPRTGSGIPLVGGLPGISPESATRVPLRYRTKASS